MLQFSRGKALFTLDSLGLTTKAAAQSLKDCCRFDGPNLHGCLWALQRASFLGVLYVLHPGKLTWNPKDWWFVEVSPVASGDFHGIFTFYVSFRMCTYLHMFPSFADLFVSTWPSIVGGMLGDVM